MIILLEMENIEGKNVNATRAPTIISNNRAHGVSKTPSTNNTI